MTEPYTGPKCILKLVQFYPEYRFYDEHTGRWHSKGANVTLEWWDTVKQMYTTKKLQVSRARGIQFQREMVTH